MDKNENLCPLHARWFRNVKKKNCFYDHQHYTTLCISTHPLPAKHTLYSAVLHPLVVSWQHKYSLLLLSNSQISSVLTSCLQIQHELNGVLCKIKGSYELKLKAPGDVSKQDYENQSYWMKVGIKYWRSTNQKSVKKTSQTLYFHRCTFKTFFAP